MSRRPSRHHWEIRKATTEDEDDVLALWSQSLAESPPQPRTAVVGQSRQSRERLSQALADPDLEVLLARVAERAVAFLVMRQTVVNVLTGATALCVDEFYVAPADRRHGLGRALLAAVAAHAERLGAEQILAGVPPWSKDTHRYFARLGFAPVMVRRAITPAALRRRLAGGDGQRGTLENLLSRRRSLRARARRRRGSGGGEIMDDDAPVGV